jgi:hypothetical protein
MPRLARVVIVDVAHPVTQCGNGRQFILTSDAERVVYLDLLRQAVRGYGGNPGFRDAVKGGVE